MLGVDGGRGDDVDGLRTNEWWRMRWVEDDALVAAGDAERRVVDELEHSVVTGLHDVGGVEHCAWRDGNDEIGGSG